MDFTTKEYMERAEYYKLEDKKIKDVFDYMYSNLDYDNDREKIREKYLKEMNKRISLKDIGETLDDLVLENKAKYAKHYRLEEHWNTQPERAKNDYTSEDFKWSGRVMKLIDPKSPLFIDDPTIINGANVNMQPRLDRIKEMVDHNDATRDHSEHALTKDEKNEVSLFHSMK
jgi:hypothetical protein